LFLKFAKTGPVLLSGDLYHYPEERSLGIVPGFDVNPDQTRKSPARHCRQRQAEESPRVLRVDARGAARATKQDRIQSRRAPFCAY
jgi:hypothetical protein